MKLITLKYIIMNTSNNSFDPTPRLKSSPVPVLFIPFKNNENNARCIEHKETGNNFCTTNIQEWCEYCSEISYFRQIIPNDLSFNNYLLNIYRNIDYKLCNNQRWSLSCCNNCDHTVCPGCYQISSEWVESSLTKKNIPILYLPW